MMKKMAGEDKRGMSAKVREMYGAATQETDGEGNGARGEKNK